MFSLRILQRKIEKLETTHTFQVRLQYPQISLWICLC